MEDVNKRVLVQHTIQVLEKEAQSFTTCDSSGTAALDDGERADERTARPKVAPDALIESIAKHQLITGVATPPKYVKMSILDLTREGSLVVAAH